MKYLGGFRCEACNERVTIDRAVLDLPREQRPKGMVCACGVARDVTEFLDFAEWFKEVWTRPVDESVPTQLVF